MPSNHLVLCHPLLLVPLICPRIRVFSNESALCIRCVESKYWSLSSASVLPMNIQDWFPLWLTGLISLQSKRPSRVFSSTTSVLWHSAFFMIQLSHLYMTIGKSIVLTIQTFVSKVMSLLYNTLPGFVIVFLPRSKRLNFRATVTLSVILESKKRKSVSFHLFPIYLPWSDGTRCHRLGFF